MGNALLDLVHAVAHLGDERLHIVAGGLDLGCGRVLLIRLNIISTHIDIAHQLAYLPDGAK